MRVHRCLVVVGGLLFNPALALGQGVSIDHKDVGCVLAEKFPRFDARLDPAAAVARARVNFRPEGGPHWYYVEMKPEAGLFHGILPKPQKTLHRFSYYIDVTDKAFHASRTAEIVAEVATGPAACKRDKVLAAGLSRANVLLHAPEGVAGAPAVPGGFAADGVVAAGGASTTAGPTAAASGGLGTKAVILGTALAAGGAAAVVAATSGGDSAGSTSPPPASTPPAGPPPTTPPPTTPPAGSLTGKWIGTRPSDGLALDNLDCGGGTGPVCSCGFDLDMDLSQSGSSLSGSFVTTIKENPGVACSIPGPSGACTCGEVGDVVPGTLTGSVNGTAITMQWAASQEFGIGIFNLVGTLTGNTMSGTLTGTDTQAATTGTWVVSRQ